MILTVWSIVAGLAHGEPLTADKVPAKVRESFRAKFPEVKKVEWKLKDDKNYEAEFTQKDVEVAAKFDENGKWVETETAIAKTELPKEVRAKISREFKDYKVIETQKVERPDGKPVLFEVHLENPKEVLKVQLEANGTIAARSSKPKNAP
jgi:hypothetical protein